jgi:phosphoglycolate phosphatase
MRLVLFDIDGTLLLGGGAGGRAMGRAGQAVLGPAFSLEGIDFAGALDTWIYAEAARRMAYVDAHTRHTAFHDAYLIELARELAEAELRPVLLPGVLELVNRLAASPELTLGIVTGNYRRAAPLKLAAVGLDPSRFTIGAFADEAETRPALVRLAMQRFAALGKTPAASHTLVIGDTPRDVACARENGCRCLAVATGNYSVDALVRAGADAVVSDLTDTTYLDEWLNGAV